jgi:hypothetical protein
VQWVDRRGAAKPALCCVVLASTPDSSSAYRAMFTLVAWLPFIALSTTVPSVEVGEPHTPLGFSVVDAHVHLISTTNGIEYLWTSECPAPLSRPSPLHPTNPASVSEHHHRQLIPPTHHPHAHSHHESPPTLTTPNADPPTHALVLEKGPTNPSACPCRPPCYCNWTLADYEITSKSSWHVDTVIFCEVDAAHDQWLAEAKWVVVVASSL